MVTFIKELFKLYFIFIKILNYNKNYHLYNIQLHININLFYQDFSINIIKIILKNQHFRIFI
jgi:hypothetical protein